MGTRRQFTGRYTFSKVSDVAADNADAGTANSTAYDTNLGESPSLNVDVATLAVNKKIKHKIQESDTNNAGWADVPVGEKTDCNPDTEIDAIGVKKYFYAGQKRYIRLVVTSVGANPGSVSRVYGRLDNLAHIPGNTGI